MTETEKMPTISDNDVMVDLLLESRIVISNIYVNPISSQDVIIQNEILLVIDRCLKNIKVTYTPNSPG